MQEFAYSRFAISLFLVLVPSTFAICQTAPRDFQFGPSGQTTVALSDQSTIEATINGKGPFKLFFDTGASVNILNPEVIAQLGLTSEGGQNELQGFAGGKVEAKPYRADELRIGDLTLAGPTFYSIPMPLPITGIVGAVGYELMSRLIINADNERQQLTFYDPAQFVYNDAGEKLELLPDEYELIVHATIGKIPGDFILDTGAAGNIGISLNHWFAQRYHLPHHLLHHLYYKVASRGADGDTPPGKLDRIKTLCLGTACVPDILGEFYHGDDKSQYAGRIGNDVLRRFTFTIDWQHRAVFLKRTSRWDQTSVYNQTGLDLNPEDSGSALVVAEVYPHSPASQAHIHVGDRILFIDNRPPQQTWYSDDPAFLQSAGTVVTLTIQHNKSSQQIKLKLKDIL
jgi:predicted aspartyl protease